MARNLAIYLLGFTLVLCSVLFFVNTSVALNDFDREQYYGINTGKPDIVKLDSAEKAKTDEAKKDEAVGDSKENKGKMNVYFCGCYGDEWKQPVNEPIHEMCPICGMGTKGTGCGKLLKTE